jgi:diaminopimelate epimerase
MTDQNTYSNGLPFLKMHGLGNDFVILDLRNQVMPLSTNQIMAIGDRRRGVGFDQLAGVFLSDLPEVAAKITFWNADGSTAGACGNATRCIGRLLLDELRVEALVLETERGLLPVQSAANGLVSVNMGKPGVEWFEIPLANKADTLSLPLPGSPVATSMGNPHCTFFVDDIVAVDLKELGAQVETDVLFSERTNVQIVQVVDRSNLLVRVWERGVGVTLASGSSSCAVVVAAHRKGLTERRVQVHLDGGTLAINWADDGVWMTGPTAVVFNGMLAPEFLEQAR